MILKTVFIKTEFIKLSQFLKFANVIASGGDSKEFLANNQVIVNDEIESRRGRKLFDNDQVKINNSVFVIKYKKEER